MAATPVALQSSARATRECEYIDTGLGLNVVQAYWCL